METNPSKPSQGFKIFAIIYWVIMGLYIAASLPGIFSVKDPIYIPMRLVVFALIAILPFSIVRAVVRSRNKKTKTQ